MAAMTQQRVQSSAASNSGPSSSAPVLEFVCLFSRDLRKKQKRWQDGRLKYHAFNKRVMVYDERGNFVGDTHWREDYDFDEGEEFELERGGVIVQTAECVGSRTQDLSELIDKRAQEKAQRQSAAAARHSSPSAPASVPRPPHAPPGLLQLHSRPLQNMVGTPTGHYGRAVVPSESPYEQRQRQNAEQANPDNEESPRPAKRRKRDIEPPRKSGYAQNLFGATLSLSAVPMSSAPVRHQPRKALQTSGNHSFPKPSGQGDEDSEVEGRQTPSDTDIPLPKPRPLAESTASSNVRQPAVKTRKPTHAAQKAREPVPLIRGNTREDPIAIDLASSQEESYNAPKRAQNTADESVKPRPIGTFSLQPKSKPKESRREALKDRTLGNRFDVDLPAGSGPKEFVQIAGNSTAEAPAAGRRRLAIDKQSTLSECSGRPLAASTGSLQHAKETTGNTEARIELRVKSRKKRGLLMMAEKSMSKKPRNSDGPDSGSSFSFLESSPPPAVADINNKHVGEDLGPCLPSRQDRLPRKTARESSSKYEADVHATHDVQFSPAAADSEVEAPWPGAPRPNSGAQKVKGPVKRGKEASNDRSFNVKPPEDVCPDERCYSSDDPFEVMSIVGEVKGQIPGTRQALEMGGLGVEARMSVDQDSDEMHIDDVSRGMRISGPESEVLPGPKERRSSTRETANKSEKAPRPRLVRLSRKGIRSKEVIGLTFDDDDDDNDKPAVFATARVQDVSDTKMQQKDKATEETPLNIPCYQEQNDRSALCAGASGQQPTPLEHEVYAVSSSSVKPSRALPADGLGRHGLRDTLPKPREEPQNTYRLPPKARADNDPGVEWTSETASSGETTVAPTASKDVSAPKGPVRGRADQPRTRPDAHPDEPPPGQQQHTTVLQEAPLSDIEAAAAQALPRAQPIPRLANPATRGRKAAKASDAAGKMPETILPAEAPSFLGKQPSRMPVNTGNGGEPAPELPGFSKATGGPWSREAHDLFEFTRPQGKAA